MITSPDNEKLKLIRKLRMKKHRAKLALFVTEGEDLARAGLASGLRPEALLTRPGFELEDTAGAPVSSDEVEPDLLDRASAMGSGSRVIAIWPERWSSAGDLGGTCFFLDGIGDPGNIGTIIRTVDALVEGTVVVGPGCADPFAPGSVRASMGSIFNQSLTRAGVEETPEPRIAMVVRGGDAPGPRRGPVTICLGSEREGLSPATLNRCGVRWTVPQRERGAESLNVAAAAAIACERVSSPMAAGETS